MQRSALVLARRSVRKSVSPLVPHQNKSIRNIAAHGICNLRAFSPASRIYHGFKQTKSTKMPEDSINKSRLPNGSRTSIANRDKPLFTSRRRQQQQQEFTTESLNTTFIPSPSPSKPKNSSPTHAKPRQARGQVGGYSAALKAIEDRREARTKSPQKTGSTSRSRDKLSKTISPRQSIAVSPNPSLRSQSNRNATRTPSPKRGRTLDSLVSPISDASSPPRGLAEAYQRINDEEDLAGLEGNSSGSLPEEEGEESRSLQDIAGRSQRLQEPISPSPSPRPSHRRLSPLTGLQAPQNAAISEEGDTTRNSRLSITSQDLIPDDMFLNDTLSRKEQDQQRVDNALGTDARPFRKAKRRSGLTLGGLKRDDTSSQSGSSSFGSSATGSILSDPALNVPQGWGRKARHGRTWLHRINGTKSDTDLSQEPTKEKSHEDEEKIRAIQDWQATAASTPLPPITESDSLQASSPAETKENHHIRSTASRDRIRRWELGESSFLRPHSSGSPSGKARNSAIDLIRDREIQNLTKSAVTTNRLGELRERQSLERLGSRSPNASAESLQPQSEPEPHLPPEPVAADQSSMLAPKKGHHTFNQESTEEARHSVPGPDSPAMVINSRSSTPTLSNSNAGSRAVSVGRSKQKHDTRDILRQLARVASPDTTARLESFEQNTRKNSKSKIGPSDFDELEARKQPLPDHARDLNTKSTDAHNPILNTPQQSGSNNYLKTPLVTGAWIDTPATVKDQPRPFSSSQPEVLVKNNSSNSKAPENQVTSGNGSKNSRPPLEDTAPKLPKSALTAIIERAKEKSRGSRDSGNDDTLQLDDSTIESLEEFLASSEGEPPSSSPPTPPEQVEHQVSRKPVKKAPVPKTRKLHRQKDGDMESEDYNRLTSRLSYLHSSITEAKEGLGSLQKRLKKIPADNKSRSLSRSNSQSRGESECNEAGEFHDFIWPCEKCGHSRVNGVYDNEDGSILEWHWRPIQVLIPRLWLWPAGWRLPRLTRLGWWATLALALVVAELVLW